MLRSSMAATTPTVHGCVQYRSSRNFRDPAFLGPRIGDKFIFAFIIFSCVRLLSPAMR